MTQHAKVGRRTLTLSVGRDTVDGTGTLSVFQWRTFREAIDQILVDNDAEVHFSGTGVGIYNEQTEESATWVVSVFSDWRSSNSRIRSICADVRALLVAFGQESFALTIGSTHIVGLEPISIG